MMRNVTFPDNTTWICCIKVYIGVLLPKKLCFNPAERDMVKTYFRTEAELRMVSNSGTVEGKSTASPGKHV